MNPDIELSMFILSFIVDLRYNLLVKSNLYLLLVLCLILYFHCRFICHEVEG